MTIIGHGTYGCIYKPPIKCKTRKVSYVNKIAKLLTKKSAETEYNEYSIVSKIDPKNKYHLGKPVLCEADAEDLKKKTDAHPCEKYEDEKSNSEFRLLIMEYGGIELRKYIENPEQMTNSFWKKARNLLEGAELFAKNGLTHRDIKVANILMNNKHNRIIYIDFGLSRSVEELTKDILNGTKKTSFHWSYPFEYGLLSQAHKIIKMTDAEADNLYRKILRRVIIDETTEEYKNVNTTFALLENRLSPFNKSKVETMIYDSIDSMRQFETAEECVKTTVKTIDMFSLGLALNETLNAYYDAGKITNEFYKEMHKLFAKMTNFNMKERIGNYSELIVLYDKIIRTFNKVNKLTKTRKQ